MYIYIYITVKTLFRGPRPFYKNTFAFQAPPSGPAVAAGPGPPPGRPEVGAAAEALASRRFLWAPTWRLHIPLICPGVSRHDKTLIRPSNSSSSSINMIEHFIMSSIEPLSLPVVVTVPKAWHHLPQLGHLWLRARLAAGSCSRFIL